MPAVITYLINIPPSRKEVVLTSKEAMQTVLTNEAAFGRDTSGMFGDRVMHKNLGIATSEGEVWEKTRNWTFRTLREFGFGKSLDMEHFIQVHVLISDKLLEQYEEIC